MIDYLVRDPDNPSSIFSCLETARRNARAVRTALTVDMWDALNETWLKARDARRFRLRPPSDLLELLDWVKERSLLFIGAYANTMLRNDAYYFTRLGTFIERADNTARILDVKYHVLLPQHEGVGGALDYYQWQAILRSVSALRSYHWVYQERLKPWLVAEFLILRPEMPRSLLELLRADHPASRAPGGGLWRQARRMPPPRRRDACAAALRTHPGHLPIRAARVPDRFHRALDPARRTRSASFTSTSEHSDATACAAPDRRIVYDEPDRRGDPDSASDAAPL